MESKSSSRLVEKEVAGKQPVSSYVGTPIVKRMKDISFDTSRSIDNLSYRLVYFINLLNDHCRYGREGVEEDAGGQMSAVIEGFDDHSLSVVEQPLIKIDRIATILENILCDSIEQFFGDQVDDNYRKANDADVPDSKKS